jgi:hypothetical protein
MTFAVVASPFYLNIPSQTLGTKGFDTGNLGFGQTVNITLVASTANSGTITITIWDQFGQQRPYSLLSGAPVLIKKAVVTRLQMSGNGNAVAGAISWPDEVSPESIVVNAPITISGTVNTDVGQGTATNPNPAIIPQAAQESGATYSALSNGTTLLFTCPASVKTLIGHLFFDNTTTNTVTISMYIEGAALAVQFPIFPAATTVASTATYSVGPEPENTLVWLQPIFMYPAEKLYVVVSGISGTGSMSLYWVVWESPLGT